eukprot:5474900-Pyramimonas_sp.AAC.1
MAGLCQLLPLGLAPPMAARAAPQRLRLPAAVMGRAMEISMQSGWRMCTSVAPLEIGWTRCRLTEW